MLHALIMHRMYGTKAFATLWEIIEKEIQLENIKSDTFAYVRCQLICLTNGISKMPFNAFDHVKGQATYRRSLYIFPLP